MQNLASKAEQQQTDAYLYIITNSFYSSRNLFKIPST